MLGIDDRYYWPLAPVLVGLSFLLLQTLGHGSQQPGGAAGQRPSAQKQSNWPAIVLAVVLCSSPFVTLAKRCISPRGAVYVEIARQLRPMSVAGPLAASEWVHGLYVSHYLDMIYLGQPAGDSAQEMAAQLAAAGVGTFLVADDLALAGELEAQPALRRIATIELARDSELNEVAVFAVGRAQDTRPGDKTSG